MDTLRSLIVDIDFRELDLGKLAKMDREIDKVESEIKNLANDIKRVDSATDIAGDGFKRMSNDATRAADKAGRSMDDLRDKVKKVGDEAKGLDFTGRVADGVSNHGGIAGGAIASGVRVGGPVAAIAAAGMAGPTAGTMIGASMDESFKIMEVRSGAAGEELEKLKRVSKSVYKDGIGADLRDATGAVAVLGGQFRKLSDEDLSYLVKGSSMISAVFEGETKEVSRAIKAMTSNFDGLQETKALDLITVAYSKQTDYANDLLDTVSEYSTYFDAMGLSAEQFIGSLIVGAEKGAFNTDKIGDSLKELGINAVMDEKQVREAYEALGFDADKMMQKFAAGGAEGESAFRALTAALSFVDDKVKQNDIGVKLWRTQWEDVKADVILAMNGAEEAVVGFEGSTKRNVDKLQDTLQGDFAKVWRRAKMWVMEGFEGSEQPARDALQKLRGVTLEGFKEYFDSLPGKIGEGMTAIGNKMFGDFTSIGDGVWGHVEKISGFIGNMLDGTDSTLGNDLKSIYNAFQEGFSFGKFYEIGKQGIAGFVKGMRDDIAGIANAAKDAGRTALDSMKGILKIQSPSKEFEKLGVYSVDGYKKGFENGTGDVERAAANLSSSALSGTRLAPTSRAAAPSNPVFSLTINGANMTQEQMREVATQSFMNMFNQLTMKMG